ncbi:MAG: DEAD/DEAH box helicase [Elusimicrobiota bacterium]
MTNKEQPATAGFYGLGIAPKLLSALDALKFETPTPIQRQAIPHAVEGKDLVGIAQTGTGKTIAFAIPMIQRLAAIPGKGLVLTPTRELALQVSEVFRQFAPMMGISGCVIIGGESISSQIRELHRNPRIIIATPGRLQDHLNQGTVKLSDVKVIVLDEADRMFDMGFAPQIERILRSVPKDRQTMLFSATMPDEIMKLAGHHMRLPTRVEVATQGTVAEKVEQQLYVVNRAAKPDLLNKLLQTYGGSVLLFVRTKHNARKIAVLIREMGHNAAEIHSNRSLSQRREALDGFKSGKYRILVATDIAARGIDVTGIELVINYDLPDDENNYIHRIGRTGRAGKSGRAVSFAAPDQANEVRSIEKLIRMPLPIITHPDMPPASFHGPARAQIKPGQGRPSGGGSRRTPAPRPARPGVGYQRPSSAPKSAFKSFPERGRSSGNAAPGRRPGPGRNASGPGNKAPHRPASGDSRGRVSQSAYFEGEAPSHNRHDSRRGGTRAPQRDHGQPREEIKKTPGQTGWFSKFLKNKKNNI